MNKPYFITTAIPYVNAKPHLGHAFEFVFCDAARRYWKKKNGEALLLSGSDENALKNVQAAEKAGTDLKTFIDVNTELFRELARKLDIEIDVFQRGGDSRHHASSQKLWELCNKAGDIYEKEYQGLYCVGCEAFYTPDELTETGECFEHPGVKLEVVSEKNYFFRLSKYQDRLARLIASDTLRVIPETRKNEVLGFLRQPLQDISISRSNERARNWGVPVPNDNSQRMYVWFDALNIYQSGVGFGWDDDLYKKWWPADVHVIGKGILRFHAVYWPAFLMSAGLPLPKSVFVHGYLTVQGQKMSKTVGNVIGPEEIIEKFGADASRYLLLATLPNGSDADVDLGRLTEKYNADLADGIGNFLSRITTLADSRDDLIFFGPQNDVSAIKSDFNDYKKAMEKLDFFEAILAIQKVVRWANHYLTAKHPWSITNLSQSVEAERKRVVLETLISAAGLIGEMCQPFIHQTGVKIFGAIGVGDFEKTKGRKVVVRKIEHLFPRIDA